MTEDKGRPKAPKLKLASGRKLRKVSLKHLLDVQAALTAHGKAGLFDKTASSSHSIIMSPRALNLLKKHIVSVGLADVDEHARTFAECDTCPPWPEDEILKDTAVQKL